MERSWHLEPGRNACVHALICTLSACLIACPTAGTGDDAAAGGMDGAAGLGSAGASSASGGGGGGDAVAGTGFAGTSSASGAGGAGGDAAGTGSAGAGGDWAGCHGPDRVTYGTAVYDEAPIASQPNACDPQIMAAHYEDLLGLGPGYSLLLHHDLATSGMEYQSFMTMNVYGVEPGVYAIGETEGHFAASWFPDGSTCVVTRGSLTLEYVGAIGGVLSGRFEFAEIREALSGSGACPEPAAGDFHMTIVDSSAFFP